MVNSFTMNVYGLRPINPLRVCCYTLLLIVLGTTYAELLAKPRSRWTFLLPSGQTLQRGNAIVSYKNRLVVTTAEGSLHLLDPFASTDDDKIVFSYTPELVDSTISSVSGAAVLRGKLALYTVIDSGTGVNSRLLCVNLLDGSLAWGVSLEGSAVGTPLVSRDFVYVVHNVQGEGRISVLRAKEMATPTIVSTFPDEKVGPLGPASLKKLNGRDALVVAESSDQGFATKGAVYMLQEQAPKSSNAGGGPGGAPPAAEDPTYVFYTVTNYVRSAVTAPILSDNMELFLAQQGSVMAGWVDQNDLSQFLSDPTTPIFPRWERFLQENEVDSTAPILAQPALSQDGDYLYVASAGQNFYCINIKDARALWTADLTDVIVAPPLLHDGVVYLIEHTGRVRQYDELQGTKYWDYDCSATGSCSANVEADFVISGTGNVLYYGDTEGRIVALEVGNFATPAPTASPTFAGTRRPTPPPVVATSKPTMTPTKSPVAKPTNVPTLAPVLPGTVPAVQETAPTVPNAVPTVPNTVPAVTETVPAVPVMKTTTPTLAPSTKAPINKKPEEPKDPQKENNDVAPKPETEEDANKDKEGKTDDESGGKPSQEAGGNTSKDSEGQKDEAEGNTDGKTDGSEKDDKEVDHASGQVSSIGGYEQQSSSSSFLSEDYFPYVVGSAAAVVALMCLVAFLLICRKRKQELQEKDLLAKEAEATRKWQEEKKAYERACKAAEKETLTEILVSGPLAGGKATDPAITPQTLISPSFSYQDDYTDAGQDVEIGFEMSVDKTREDPRPATSPLRLFRPKSRSAKPTSQFESGSLVIGNPEFSRVGVRRKSASSADIPAAPPVDPMKDDMSLADSISVRASEEKRNDAKTEPLSQQASVMREPSTDASDARRQQSLTERNNIEDDDEEPGRIVARDRSIETPAPKTVNGRPPSPCVSLMSEDESLYIDDASTVNTAKIPLRVESTISLPLSARDVPDDESSRHSGFSGFASQYLLQSIGTPKKPEPATDPRPAPPVVNRNIAHAAVSVRPKTGRTSAAGLFSRREDPLGSLKGSRSYDSRDTADSHGTDGDIPMGKSPHSSDVSLPKPTQQVKPAPPQQVKPAPPPMPIVKPHKLEPDLPRPTSGDSSKLVQQQVPNDDDSVHTKDSQNTKDDVWNSFLSELSRAEKSFFSPLSMAFSTIPKPPREESPPPPPPPLADDITTVAESEPSVRTSFPQKPGAVP